jgi:imidazolonepropionase-like amidohydrolase
MRHLLVSGATTARDTGSREDVALAVRSAVRDGLVPGPRLLVVGAPITTTAGHYWFLGGEADTADEVVARVRASKRAGVDAIKVMASGGGYTPTSNPRSEQYPRDTLSAAVNEAHRLGLPVLAHALTARSTRQAAEAGVDTIVHGGVWWTDHAVRDMAYAYDPAVSDLIAERGIWVDPTIGETELHREHEEAGLPPLPAFEHWALPDVPSDLEPRLGFMRDMAARGVRFIGGMGMGMPIVTFDSVACSAQAYVRLLGFDPWHAIRSITTDAASSLGLGDEVGRLRPGMAADLVSVGGDPIGDAAEPAGLASLRKVRDVIQGGRPVVRDGRPLV